MNPAYKHLDTRLKVHELTIGQWAAVFVGLGIALLWGLILSPLGLYATLVSAIYIGGIPVGAAVLANISELDLWLLIRSAIRWRRDPGCFVPGPGEGARGYVVHAELAAAVVSGSADIDLDTLWEAR